MIVDPHPVTDLLKGSSKRKPKSPRRLTVGRGEKYVGVPSALLTTELGCGALPAGS